MGKKLVAVMKVIYDEIDESERTLSHDILSRCSIDRNNNNVCNCIEGSIVCYARPVTT